MEEPAATDLQPVTDNNYQLPKVLAEMIIILIQPAWKKVEKSAK